jgi:hypothetical protein
MRHLRNEVLVGAAAWMNVKREMQVVCGNRGRSGQSAEQLLTVIDGTVP